jgi:hypothetical protein
MRCPFPQPLLRRIQNQRLKLKWQASCQIQQPWQILNFGRRMKSGLIAQRWNCQNRRVASILLSPAETLRERKRSAIGVMQIFVIEGSNSFQPLGELALGK